jgi:superfamily II DNA helicase RecQ
VSPDAAPAAEYVRRDYGEALPGDPFLDAYPDWQEYRGPGQREAIRGLLTAPAGATLLANLPTGSGKSLCAYLPSLLDPRSLTVVVVPTTALALDQERVLLPHIGHPTAYHGGTDAATEARNRAVRERIRAGTQRIVFASPESVLKSLAGSLYIAAASGTLRYLVLDEAHIVDQWGDDFRPEFQELAGFRRDLLRVGAAPLTTLLLSGTVTEGCLDTLETLFGRPGPFSVISAVQLRPEPAYWVAESPNPERRADHVIEALSHLPRPLILYVTTVPDANAWLDRLRALGFSRAAVVTGQTGTSVRAEVVRGWQAGEIDLVVATSAFGLGMDKGDVRAVVHACLPEHADRFYQEVGRGGRDGKASVSLLLHCPEDEQTARRLSRKTLITTDEETDNKGFERWKAMFYQRTEMGDGRSRVRTDVVPEYGFGRFENNSHNVAWNVHTLVLLARAGVIELDAQEPPRRDRQTGDNGEGDEEALQREIDRHRHERVVRVIEEGHLDLEATWQGTVERARERSAAAAARGLDLMLEVRKPKRCLAEVFADAYEVAARAGDPPRPPVLVSKSCGGCPACRAAQRSPYAGGMPAPLPAWRGLDVPVPAELAPLFGGWTHLVIFDDKPAETFGGDRQRRERLLRSLARSGFRSVVGPDPELVRLRALYRAQPWPAAFYSAEWEPLHLPRSPTLVYRPDDPTIAALFGSGRSLASPEILRIVWLPADTRDPSKPHCLLAHTVPGPSYRFEEFCVRVGIP